MCSVMSTVCRWVADLHFAEVRKPRLFRSSLRLTRLWRTCSTDSLYGSASGESPFARSTSESASSTWLTRSTKIIGNFTSTLHAHLNSILPSIFPTHLQSFLTSSLSTLPSHLLDPPPHPQLLSAVPINLQRVPPPSPHFSRLGLLPKYSAILSKVAYTEIERLAKEEAAKGWGARRLTRARQRVGDGVANWLSGMFDGEVCFRLELIGRERSRTGCA